MEEEPPRLPIDVLVVGAGNFGAATAFELVKRGYKNIALLDLDSSPNPRAASHDINKIVRDDYPDPLYMRMLQKAMPLWRHHDNYKEYYHEVGMLRADPSNFGPESIASYKNLGIHSDARMMPVDEVRQGWNGVFADTNFGDLSHVLYNPNVGYGEAEKALGAVLKLGAERGVRFVQGTATKLFLGPDGECQGVVLETDQILRANKVLLCTGARTPALLAASAPENKLLHAGDRIIATGAVSFHTTLHGEQRAKFQRVPVLKNCLPEVKGESMSMLEDGTFKFNCDLCFTNYAVFPATGDKMSLVPDDDEHQVWTGPDYIKFFKEKAQKTMKGLYGKEVEGVAIENYRMCWDASTPTHDFLITPHPHSPRLYIATGGSFHGWKFLPVIGEYIADMVSHQLDPEYAARWAWDRAGNDDHSANPTYQVIGDLQDFAKA
ncbi:FAD dependent oxidoreductase [Stachybotrys elegans]|uniref:FAD dependent oxidoreductase n=1 Tax=Stachybotrys elegans TaxID=80388 RepID=A0A8K0WRP4_9HYPO|nr:FAD dependent oxidoreductase [Stachybotrys elegans]